MGGKPFKYNKNKNGFYETGGVVYETQFVFI